MTEQGADTPLQTRTETEKSPGHERPEAPRGFGARHTQALILFTCLSTAFTLRAQLSVTMVAMTQTPPEYRDLCHTHTDNHTRTCNVTLSQFYDNKSKWSVYRTYDWSKPTQEMMMYSFFVGYTSMMIPMGMVAQKFGGKRPIMGALLINGLVSILTPWMTLLGGWVAMCVCRVVQGMSQACCFPSMHTMLGQWAPITERGRLSTYIYTGSQFGTVVIFQVSGFLSSSSLGWPSVMWLCGGLSFMSLAVLARWGSATPADHPSITREELLYIAGNVVREEKRAATPWRQILRCPAVWGAVVTHCGSAVGYIFIFTEIPLYINSILGVDIKRSGVYSSLPYIGMCASSLMFGAVTDYLANNNYMKLVNVRRLANTIGMVVSGGFLVWFSYVTSAGVAVFLMVMCLAAHSGVHVGFLINQIDLAPNFAGPILSIGNMLGSLTALGVPVLVSYIVTDVRNQSQWQVVCCVVACIQTATNLVFVVLARADVQTWNYSGSGDHERGWGYRHQQCGVLFCCVTIAYSMRTCMGVALVAMTGDSRAGNLTNVTDNSDSTSVWNMLMLSGPYPQFPWSKKVQDTILSSFFWGYMSLQIPAGQLAHRYGTKYLIMITMGINALVSLCLPWAALYGGWVSMVCLRTLQGLSQASLFPSAHTFFGRWAPLQERGRLTALVYGGQALGSVLGLTVSGFIASSRWGWPGIFRFYGVLSAIMCAVWSHYGADSPAVHARISSLERSYIERGLGRCGGDTRDERRLTVPWRHILCSSGMWAIVAAHVGHSWGQLVLYSEVPAYMHHVLKVDIRANGVLTALPFLVMFFSNMWCSVLADCVVSRRLLSVTNTRKLFNTIGCWPPAALFVILAYCPSNIYLVETLLVLICSLKIAAHLGFQVNHIDISPNFAGTMMSISNFASNLVGSFAPLTAGLLLTDETSVVLWRRVFFVAAGMYFFSNLFYLVRGSAVTATWNDPRDPHVEDDPTELINRTDDTTERFLKS